MKLSILDQSPVAEGMTAAEALRNTADLARKAEKWGYYRFWVSEHHDSASLAGTSPEVLIAHLGAHTKSIRLGSGGVMLPHYSPFKVAENFHILEALYPGRIDAGIGRAPGGMPRATLALSEGKPRRAERFPRQVDDLLRYIRFETIPEYAYGEAAAGPVTETFPPVWILGSGEASARLAAEKGLPYSFAHFINGEGGETFVKEYKKNFQPSINLTAPKHIVTVFALCADTEEKADYIASSLDLSLLSLGKGMALQGTPSPESAAAYSYTGFDRARMKENRERMIIGSPQKVKRELLDFAEAYEAEEIMICTIAYHHEDRLRSYALIKDMI
ncbi:LLM class flavin-dependent oxidoreductase [Alkalicoccus halolimnae]|uniref:LLM class flavin-dependent oxidoreductase n=1 Tax=Alkalicoccus halolimnae TaxID=1667239 RepID=A0A5C7F6T0_9BACI|nr:LLM class flavin-dependent oxidoreductase [Alkalicoccus halolimnae]TXF85108.1 LLM class flavin-dependent oxidoreductase [Alkalicoccus halolimnae]